MEAALDLFTNLHAECQNLQWQEYGQLHLLLRTVTSPSEASWAARSLRNVDGPACVVLLPGMVAQAAWASRTLLAPKKRDCPLHFPTGAYKSSTAPFASLSVSSSPPTGSAVPGTVQGIVHNSERWECCGRSTQQLQTQNQGSVSIKQLADGQQNNTASLGNDLRQLQNLSGTWIKNRKSSESMEDAMNLMHLNGIVRQAVNLVKGVSIKVDPDNFTFTVFSVIAWFKVKEVYPMNGEERHYRRRDLRRGGALGHVERQGRDIQVQLRWSDPFGGQGRDHFRLISEDELHIESFIEVAGQTARYLTVYNRKPDRRSSQ